MLSDNEQCLVASTVSATYDGFFGKPTSDIESNDKTRRIQQQLRKNLGQSKPITGPRGAKAEPKEDERALKYHYYGEYYEEPEYDTYYYEDPYYEYPKHKEPYPYMKYPQKYYYPSMKSKKMKSMMWGKGKMKSMKWKGNKWQGKWQPKYGK